MKFCPKCGAEVDDDNKFCYRCGSPLDGSDSSVTAQQQEVPPQAEPAPIKMQTAGGPKKKSSDLGVYALIAILLVIALLSVVFLPTSVITTEEYNVTVEIQSMSITDNAKMYSTDSSGNILTQFEFGYGKTNASETFTFSKDSCKDANFYCKTDGTVADVKASKTFKISGSPDTFAFSLFFCVKATHGESTITDYVDIYTAEFKEGSAKPDYIGYSGVKFYVSDLKDNVVTFTGDSDPIGSVTMKITWQKI